MVASSASQSDSRAPPHPQLAAAAWLCALATRKVLAAIEAEGHRARVVGGAVRNTLLGLDVADIDIATDALPDEVGRLATRAGLKVVPTGIAHGTVTVIAEAIPFEVTTLRRDAATDGRHATVAFTDCWRTDAERRDFTMNALYCDARGVLFDPVGGLVDLERHRVRFIGDAHARIREDYLRILRFFRFSAEYGEGIVDATGLEACIAERAGLQRLSAERLRAELLRLLAARFVRPVIDVMQAAGLLADILDSPADVRALHRLHDIARAVTATQTGSIGRRPAQGGRRHAARGATPAHGERERSPSVDALVSLAALAVQSPGDAGRVMGRLRLSREEARRLQAAAEAAAMMTSPPTDEQAAERRVKEVGYRLGAAAMADGVRLAWARSTDTINDARWHACARAAVELRPPRLPFTGADLVSLGIAPGPRVGELLRQFERWWIDAGFPTDAEANQAALQRLVTVTKQ